MPIIPIDELTQQGQQTQETQEQPSSNIVPIDQFIQQGQQFGQQQTQQQSSNFRDPSTAPDAPKKSPIDFLERVVLSFADDEGRESKLRSKFSIVEKLENGKFAVGNSRDDIRPIDPEGVFNDVLGDLADVVGEIPIIAGQILGTTAGALAEIPSGPVPTTLIGAGLGSAGGTVVKKAIGKMFGVNQEKAMTMATDVAINGLLGTAGEGIAQGLKFGGRGLSNVAKKFFDKSIKTSTNPSKALNVLGKVIKVTAAVNPEDTITAGTYEFSKSLAPKYMNQEYSRELMTKFSKGLIRKNDALGKMVGQGDDWAIKNFGSNKVELRPVGQKLLSALQDPKVGLVDDLGQLNRAAFTESADRNAVKVFTETFFKKNPNSGELLPRNLTVKQLIDAKKRTRPFLNKYFKSDAHSPQAKIAITQYLDDVTNATGQATIPKGLANEQIAQAVQHNPYLKANAAFSSWKQDINLLKKNGLDIADTNDLKSLFRDGRIVFQKMENFFESFKVKNSSAQQAFGIVTDKLNVKFPGGGVGGTVGTLKDELLKYNAAQGFSKATPNFLRMASIAGMMGFSFGRDDPASAMGTAALGLLVGTPAGTRILLRGGPKLKALNAGKGASVISKLLQKSAVKKGATALGSAELRRLLKDR